ncbi:protein PHLOEM PROTEIN 2-LIKE A1-like isoform X1 [Typha angustifolia]|uniref:protein PHLOEM PROTEIN 2-LIKE A1-like isoform X1 n=1 Tax=Typha angustifolia TaxID=59011 RepID=UPI003C2F090D
MGGVLPTANPPEIEENPKEAVKPVMLFARDLSITWSEEPAYWYWFPLKEKRNEEIDVALLLNVCWLEIHGKLNISDLTPRITYEVFFIIMMNEPMYGWNTPVNLRIKLPDGSVQERKESLQEKPRGKWMELKVGEFRTQAAQEGEMDISLFEYEGGQWKRGLVVKGILFRPKKP